MDQATCYARPPHGPRILRASWMSLVMTVTRLAWIAQRFLNKRRQWGKRTSCLTYASSKRWTRYASVASCKARSAELCHRRFALSWKLVSVVISFVISRTWRELVLWNKQWVSSSSRCVKMVAFESRGLYSSDTFGFLAMLLYRGGIVFFFLLHLL